MIPGWLYDELEAGANGDRAGLVARALAWSALLADGGVWEDPYAHLSPRELSMQVEADRVHEACMNAPCDCVVPRSSRVPDRCGCCIGVLSPDRQRLAEPIGRAKPR